MKKTLATFLFLAIACVSPLFAQTYTTRNGYTLPDNEISLRYGTETFAAVHLAKIDVKDDGMRIDLTNIRSIGAFSLEYQRYMNHFVAFGCIFGFETGTYDVEYTTGNGKTGAEEDFHSVLLMPSMSLKWFSLPYVSMYSKFSVGVMLHTGNHAPQVGYAFQLTLAGFDFGGKHLRGFVEAGAGDLGTFAYGLRYCF